MVLKGNPMNNTTERVYEFISKSEGHLTLDDIARGCGLSSRSVALYHVQKLAGLGRIVFVAGRHRSIRIPEVK
jgi:hypothetical protein